MDIERAHEQGFDRDELLRRWIAEFNAPFSGWEFSHVEATGRMVTAPLPWSYASVVLSKLIEIQSLVDIGTGGGEFLSRLKPLPKFTLATESFGPNVSLAQSRLKTLGVQVIHVCEELEKSLPFHKDQFDLIINRHASFDPSEVNRILKAGGELITQQVGGKNDLDLNRTLGAPATSPWGYWDLSYATDQLIQAGFQIYRAQEAFPKTRIYDVGALVFHLKAIHWQIPGFSVDTYAEALLDLHQHMQWYGFLEITSHRFLLVARKM